MMGLPRRAASAAMRISEVRASVGVVAPPQPDPLVSPAASYLARSRSKDSLRMRWRSPESTSMPLPLTMVGFQWGSSRTHSSGVKNVGWETTMQPMMKSPVRAAAGSRHSLA
jgi:hypothetical protein